MSDGMYTGLLHLHSFGRWVLLVLLLIAFFKSVTAGNRPFTNGDRRIGLFTMIMADIMLLVGITQWFVGEWGYKQFSNYESVGDLMKNSNSRFFVLEHAVLMLIAIILIHVGKGYAKKPLPDSTRHKRTATFFGLALLVILIAIPWPFREVGADRGWF